MSTTQSIPPTTDGVGADVESGVVEEFDHPLVSGRIKSRVPGIASVNLRGFLVPGFVDPCGAAATATVHENLHTARKKHAITK